MNASPLFTFFVNGKIYSLENDRLTGDCLLIYGNRIVFCGQRNDVSLPDNLVTFIDLQGYTLIPAFTDCHAHVAGVAINKERLQLDECQSKQQAIDKIARTIRTLPEGTWLLGGGWNANIWAEGRPDRQDLDNVTQKHPIALYNKDCHTQWLNSLALAQIGFTDQSKNPPGGTLGRDNKGELTGLVFEKACEIVDKHSAPADYAQLKRCMTKLYPELYQLGITSVHSCDTYNDYTLFQKMQINGELGLRISMQVPAADKEKLIDAGICSSAGNDWLRIGGLKYFMDGSLGSQTADMFDNYEHLDHSGISVMDQSELHDAVTVAAQNGLSATVHAIGDQANFKTLNVLEAIKNIPSPVPLRHRIEHSQLLQASDIPRFGQLNVIASMQPMHLTDDVEIANKYLGERTQFAYPIRSYLNSGCKVVFGSDMPVADPDPLKGILAAVYRRYLLNRTHESWQAQECIDVTSAVAAYTREAAYASYEENRKGTLQPGKLADFIVLNNDVMQADEETLVNTKVIMTVMDGNIVYRDF